MNFDFSNKTLDFDEIILNSLEGIINKNQITPEIRFYYMILYRTLFFCDMVKDFDNKPFIKGNGRFTYIQTDLMRDYEYIASIFNINVEEICLPAAPHQNALYGFYVIGSSDGNITPLYNQLLFCLYEYHLICSAIISS
jgi:hypothetical protein